MKNRLRFIGIFLVCILSSCAYFEGILNHSNKHISKSKIGYKLTDKSGQYYYQREIGFDTKGIDFIVKNEIFNDEISRSKVLERSISISSVVNIYNNASFIPKVSQYSVWFEGEKYFSQTKLNWKKREIHLKMISPEGQWDGERIIKLHNDVKYICYFSQVMECAIKNGFIAKTAKFDGGEMNFHIIWEGYPYVMEQYVGIAENIFAKAKLSFDGNLKSGIRRFTLQVDDQVIAYFLDKKNNLVRTFWVSQGLSITDPEILKRSLN